MANKISMLFEAVGADKVQAAFKDITASAEKASTGLKQASGGATSLSNSLDQLAVGAAVGAASFVALAAAGTASAAVYRAFSSEISGLASTLRKAEVEFTALTGSAAQAKTQVEALFRFAQSTPFETKSIIDAAKGLEAIGLKGAGAETALRLIGDAAAGTGTEVDKVAQAYTRVVAAFEGGEGIPAAVNAFRELGVLTAAEATEIIKLAKNADTAQQAFDLLNRKLGEFGGSMATQMNTIPALMNRLWDAIDRLVGTAFQPLIDITKEALRALTAFATDQSVMQWAEGVGTALGTALTTFKTFILDLERGVRSLAVPFAYVGSLFEDLGNRQIPSLEKAGNAAGAAMGKLDADMKRIGSSMTLLSTEQRAAGAAMDSLVTSVDRYVAAMPQLGDVTRDAGEAAKKAADAFTSAGQKLTAIAGSFQSPELQQIAKVANDFEDLARKVDALGPKFAPLAQQIRDMGNAAVELTRGQQALKAFFDEVQRAAVISTTLANLQKSIDAIHMTGAEKELAGFAEQLDKIKGLGEGSKTAILDVAAGMIRVREEAAEGKKDLQDAAKYMQDLGTAAATAGTPLSQFARELKEIPDSIPDTNLQLVILMDNIKLLRGETGQPLFPPNTIASITQYNDALRDTEHRAASAATANDILNDRVSEAGAAAIKAEQSWEKFGDGIKDMFGSVTDTFSKVVTGLIQGTTNIEDAFKNLGQSLLANFVDVVVHKMFDPLLDKAAEFVANFIETIAGGLMDFDWAGLFNTVIGWIGDVFGFGGGGGGGSIPSSGGDWFSDLDLEWLAHGGKITRTGAFGLHEGEVVIPKDRGTSGGFVPFSEWLADRQGGGGGGSGGGGVVPVAVKNFHDMPTKFQGPSGGGGGGGVLETGGAVLKIGKQAYDIGAPWLNLPTTNQLMKQGATAAVEWVGSLFSGAGAGAGQSMGLAGAEAASAFGAAAETGGAAIGAAAATAFGAGAGQSMGLAGAEAAAAFGAAVETGGYAAAGGAAAGGGFGLVGASGAAMAPGLIGGGAVLAIPAIAGFFATMGQEEIARQSRVRTAAGPQLGADMTSRAMSVQTIADLDKKYIDTIYGERTARQDVAFLAALAAQGAEGANQNIIMMERMAKEQNANFDESIAPVREEMHRMNAFVAKAAEIGIAPDFALANVSPRTVSPGHGPQAVPVEQLMVLWTEIINRLLAGTEAIADASKDVTDSSNEAAESSKGVADATSAVVQNQADLIIKYGGAVEQLRKIGDFYDIDLGIPELTQLTVEQLEFLGTATGAQIEEMIAGWRATLTDAVAKQAAADPIKLLPLLDVSTLKREGESLEEATERVATALQDLGAMMHELDVEILALKSPLEAATLGFEETIAAVEGADWEGLAAAMKSADPTDWADAAVVAHDLLIARYEAIIALGQQINEAVGQVYGFGIAITEMGSMLHSVGVSIGPMVEAGALWAGQMVTAESALTAFGGAVEAFGNLALLAGQTADPALIQSAINTFSNLMASVPAVFQQIMAIEDPTVRTQSLITFMQQLGQTAEAAAAGLKALVDTMDAYIASIGQAAGTLTTNAELFTKVGVDLGAAANSLAAFSMTVPTFTGSMAILTDAVNLGAAAMKAGVGTGTPLNQQGFVDAIVLAVQRAMELTNPAERISALTDIMGLINTVLAALPPDIREAVIAAFGPGIKYIGDQLIVAGAQQAAAVKAIGDQLVAIMGESGALSPQNFLLMMVQGINTAFSTLLQGAPGAFQYLHSAIMDSGGEVVTAINTANAALIAALGPFATAAAQLASALTTLDQNLYNAVYNGAVNGLNAVLGAESGLPYVPKTGIYMLHQGEAVLTAEENAAFMRGGLGSFQGGTGLVGRIASAIIAAIGPALKGIEGIGVDLGFLGEAWRIAGEGFSALMASNEALAAGMRTGWAIAGEAFGRLMASNDELATKIADVDARFGELLASNDRLAANMAAGWAVAGEAFGVLKRSIDDLATAITTALTGAGASAAVPGVAGVPLPPGTPGAAPDVTKSDAYKAMHPGLQAGTSYVPSTDLYLLHQGEGVLTADQNRVLGSYQTGTFPVWAPPRREAPGGRGDLRGMSLEQYPTMGSEGLDVIGQLSRIQQLQILAGSIQQLKQTMAAAAEETSELTNQVNQYVTSITSAGDALASASDALPVGTLQHLAGVFLQWANTLPDLSHKAAAFTTGIRLWAAAIVRTDDVMGALVAEGAEAYQTIQGIVKAAKDLTDAAPGVKLDALTATYNAVAQAAETMGNAVTASYARQREELDELAEASREWEGVAESLADTLRDLRLSDMAPPDALGRLRQVQAEFATAMASFRGAPTAAGAGQVQELARTVLDAASEIFTRPSPEYQALFTSITTALGEVQGVAAAQGRSTEVILGRIEDLTRQEQVALEAVKNTVVPVMQDLAAEMERVGTLAAGQAAAITAGLDVMTQGLAVQQQMEETMTKVLAELSLINQKIVAAPAYQEGGVVARTGLAFVHAGETVVPPGATNGGGGVTLNFDHITVTGTREGARDFFKEVEILTERSMRFGTLNRVIKKELKGGGA